MNAPNKTGAEPDSRRASKTNDARSIPPIASPRNGNQQASRVEPQRHSLNVVLGTPDLCAWAPTSGVSWVQTRVPHYARKLSQRQDSRLVMCGVAGGYLRTFEFHHRLSWAQRLITRYTRHAEATNARLTAPASPSSAFSPGGGSRTAEGRP